MHHVVAANPCNDVGYFIVGAYPLARRLGTTGSPSRESCNVQTGLEELFGRFGRVDGGKIENRERGGARLNGVEMQAIEGNRIQQAGTQSPRIADLELFCCLELANLVVQQGIPAVPTGIAVAHVEEAPGQLMLAGVVVELRQ